MVTESPMVSVGDFRRLNNNKYEEHELLEGDILYVAGDCFLPKEPDSYDYRRMFICTDVVDDHINTVRKPFLMDGDHLDELDEFTAKRLNGIRQKDFSETGEDESAN